MRVFDTFLAKMTSVKEASTMHSDAKTYLMDIISSYKVFVT